MGWALWVMVCQESRWQRKTQAWYSRFCSGREAVPGPELRVALMPVELEEREPVNAKQPWFVLHGVGEDGRIDAQREDEVHRASMESVPFPLASGGGVVVSASHRFARRTRDRLGRWAPNAVELDGFYHLLRSLDVPI